MIAVRGLHKTFGETALFKGLNIDVNKGEAVVCIGPSGSGKSTLLRCINGLETFDQGSVTVDGIEIHPEGSARPAAAEKEAIRAIRLKVGMVFQQFNLFPHMNVLDNIIEAPVAVLGISRDEAENQAQLLLKRVNLEKKISNFPSELSGGEQQRVAIVRTLAMKPEAILFDEPTSSLDPEMVDEVLAVIRALVDEGLTSVIATHEMDFACDVADRILVFDHGEIVESGLPGELFANPKTERTRNFLDRALRKVRRH